MKIRFYSNLNALDILSLPFLRSYRGIYYFDISRVGKLLLLFPGLKGRVKPFPFKLYEIRDASGQNSFPKIYGDHMIAICDAIERDDLLADQFISSLGQLFPTDGRKGIILFLRKTLGHDLLNLVTFLDVISWRFPRQSRSAIGTLELCIESMPFSKALSDFAVREHGIALIIRFSLRTGSRYAYRLVGSILFSLFLSCKSYVTPLINLAKADDGAKVDREPLIAASYSMKGFTFEDDQRCDFPWMLASDFPRERVLLYFERKDKQLTEDMTATLDKHGVKYVALSHAAAGSRAVPVHRPKKGLAKVIAPLWVGLLFRTGQAVLARNFAPLYFLPEFFWFIREYAEAYEFYRSYRICVNIDPVDHSPYRIARHLALAACDGITVSYQVSNWPIRNIILGSHSDVYFIFGPYYKQKLLQSGSSINTIVISGYLFDYSFRTARKRSEIIKKQLTDQGATFILCYFDENSSDDRMSVIPNQHSAKIYRQLFEWVLTDNTLGLICSPKRPKTLLTRLPEIADLMDKARATGRCLVMDGEYCAANYPNEAAQASDLVISMLIGGTTSLESLLAGIRVFYVDLENLYSYSEYEWGKNSLVYDNVDNLISAINNLRSNSTSFDKIQNENLLPTLYQKDPFRDGKASQRMGEYLSLLLDALADGMDRTKAIEYANKRYASVWGNENIITWH